MRVCIFEDAVDTLEPLTLTRAAFELRCGMNTLLEKQLRAVRATSFGMWVRPVLAESLRERHPGTPINDVDWLTKAPTLFVNGRWLPAKGCCLPAQAPSVGMIGSEVAWAAVGETVLDFESELPLRRWADELRRTEADGTMIRYPWDLVDRNAGEIERDLAETAPPTGVHPAGLHIVGPPDRVYIDPSAKIDPLVVIDATPGPVIIGRDAVVTAFTRVEGPCYIGPATQIMGAKIRGGCSFGPHCRIGGEVETSIVHGYSNKYHEGFMGHSYVGEWVNLGAGTHNSDLRNDYGEVEVTIAGRRVASGRNKVGCYLGDHTKTGLGTLLNTGTVAGVFCNILPAGRLAPKYLPSFTSWWNGCLRQGFPLPQLLITAKQVMSRRGRTLSPALVRLYEAAWESTDRERCRVVREAEQKTLRRSA